MELAVNNNETQDPDVWGNLQNDIAKLSIDEKQKLITLLSEEVLNEVKKLRDNYYSGYSLLGALILEKIYRERITQEQFAQKAGLSYYYLNKIISGKQKPGIAIAQRLNKVLGFDANLIVKLL